MQQFPVSENYRRYSVFLVDKSDPHYRKFLEVCEIVASKNPYATRLYLDVKKDANRYQLAKKSVMDNFKKNGHGDWIGKPVEQDMFSI